MRKCTYTLVCPFKVQFYTLFGIIFNSIPLPLSKVPNLKTSVAQNNTLIRLFKSTSLTLKGKRTRGSAEISICHLSTGDTAQAVSQGRCMRAPTVGTTIVNTDLAPPALGGSASHTPRKPLRGGSPGAAQPPETQNSV